MTNTEIFLAVVAGVVFINLVITFAQLSNLEKKYRYLDDRIDGRAKRWELECTDMKAIEMREHIAAIENYLGIEVVKAPSKMVVKTGESK